MLSTDRQRETLLGQWTDDASMAPALADTAAESSSAPSTGVYWHETERNSHEFDDFTTAFSRDPGATAAAAGGLPKLLAGEPAKDNIHLGMMLQGDSAADLQEKAKRIAAIGFQRVQVTFSSRPPWMNSRRSPRP